MLPHVSNLIYKLCALFSIYQTPEQTGQEVTLQEMNSISRYCFYLIEVGVKYAQLDSVGQPRQDIIDYSFFPACH